MNLSLDNPYGNVTIPRAKLRSPEDSTVIINPMALDTTYNGNNSLNPYGAFKPQGDELPPTESKEGSSQNSPPAYGGQTSYTVKEDTEEVGGRCPACCYRCRRK